MRLLRRFASRNDNNCLSLRANAVCVAIPLRLLRYRVEAQSAPLYAFEKMRRVRRIATNFAVLPDGNLLTVNDQGQVPNLWIRRRAIRVLP